MSARLIGTRVRHLRRALKMKQSDLAASAQISSSYLNLIEHNRRPVAGKLLLNLAEKLGVSSEHLTQSADTNMLERFHQTARRMPSASAELESINDFIGRFPGWANLLDDQIRKTDSQAQTLATLSDQFHHDPVLRDTLHIMLTNITAIRSTAEILVLHGALPTDQRARFDANIFQESKRLARKAEELLAAFDPDVHLDAEMPEDIQKAEQKAKSGSGFHLPIGFYNAQLETDALAVSDIISSLDVAKFIDTPAQSQQLTLWAERYRESALALPLAKLEADRASHQFDPFLIAHQFGVEIPLVFFRLAHLPDDGRDLPRFGVLEIDNSAGVLLRKELPSLRLPNRSGACPRWPVYRALSQPQQGIIAQLNPIDGLSCISYSYAWQTHRHAVGLPPLMRAMMLYKEASQSDKTGSLSIDVGFHCAICPRTSCSDRREAYALTG